MRTRPPPASAIACPTSSVLIPTTKPERADSTLTLSCVNGRLFPRERITSRPEGPGQLSSAILFAQERARAGFNVNNLCIYPRRTFLGNDRSYNQRDRFDGRGGVAEGI